jgi:hypothetical protein
LLGVVVLIITPTFTANFDTNFGADAAAAKAAWIAAARVFTDHFTDSININITVDAVTNPQVFGESFPRLLSISYADLLARVTADATTQNDETAIGPRGSMPAADPTNGVGTWWLTRSQAKALGFIPDDLSDDGGTTFGVGNSFTFSGGITAGTFDFQGVAAHEISEVMGRIGLSGGTVGTTANSFSLIDNFSYTGPGSKALRGGPGNNFSIDNGITLLKLWNDPTANHLDSRDWAGGTDDAFNQFSASGVVNPVSVVDLQLMDVIGYSVRMIASGQLLSYGDDGTPGNVSSPVTVGFGGWLAFKFLFAGKNLSGEDRIYAVDQSGQLLSYGDDGTPGNVSSPVTVGFGGWLAFKFLFAGKNLSGEDRIYAVVA